MTLSAVYRAVAIIAAALSEMPIHVQRQNEPVESRLAERPDINMTRSQFLSTTGTGLALNGEVFWWLTRNDQGQIINAAVIGHDKVQVLPRDPNAVVLEPTYWIGDRNVTPYVKHVRLQVKPGQLNGFGPLQAAWPDVTSALRLREYNDGYLDVGSPLGILKSDQVLTQDMANTYRDTWSEMMSQRTIAVLGAGMGYEPIYGDAVSVQLVDQQRLAITQIARLFGIPPQMMAAGVEGSSLTYTNVETLAQSWLQTGLAQYVNILEEAFTDLLPRGQTARLKMDALLRSDLSARTAAYEKLVTLGVMTPEEVRLSEGMSPTPTVGQVAPQASTHPQDETNGSPI